MRQAETEKNLIIYRYCVIIWLHAFEIAAASETEQRYLHITEREITTGTLNGYGFRGLEALEGAADVLIEQPEVDPESRFVFGVETGLRPVNLKLDAGQFTMYTLAALVKIRSEGRAYLAHDPSGHRESYESSGLQGKGYWVTAGNTNDPRNPTEYTPRGLMIASIGKSVGISWVRRIIEAR